MNVSSLATRRFARLSTVERGASGRPRWMDRYVRVLAVVDGVAALAGGQLGRLLRFGADDPVLASASSGVTYTFISFLLVPVWIMAMALRGGYDRRIVGVGSEEYRRVFDAAVRVLAVVAIAAFLADLALARGFLAFTLPLATALSLVGRRGARWWLRSRRAEGLYSHKMVLVGSQEHVRRLIRHLSRAPYAGFSVLGVCVPSGGENLEVDGRSVPVFGEPDEAEVVVRRLKADAVAMADTSSADALRRLAWGLEGSGVDLLVVPALTDVAGPRIVVRPVAGLPLLHVDEPRLSGFQRSLKEVFDRTAAALVLLVVAPLLVAVTVAIRLGGGGPVLFRQRRVGRNGRPFTLRKFRTMHQDAELQLAALVDQNAYDGVLFKMRRDPRCTRVGRVLRRFSIDELPQLWNVMCGDMSVVGPRPPLPSEVERYDDHVRRRLLVKPGLTGLWQVSGRSDLSWDEAVRLDLYYVENWSPAMDAIILWKTMAAVVGGRGAY